MAFDPRDPNKPLIPWHGIKKNPKLSDLAQRRAETRVANGGGLKKQTPNVGTGTQNRDSRGTSKKNILPMPRKIAEGNPKKNIMPMPKGTGQSSPKKNIMPAKRY